MKSLFNIATQILCLISLGVCAEINTKKMATMDDVANKRIGVYTGTIYDKFAVNRFPGASILRYNSISDFVLALKNNKIDVAISNLYSAKNVIKTNPEIGILTDDVLSFDIGIGFNKNNPVLRQRFNKFLAQIKEEGKYDAMYQKWFNQDIEKIKMPYFEKNQTGEKVILGVAVGDLPNAGFVNGEYVGFDLELIETFAYTEKMNLEIITMEFGALIAALAAGKVDMIADCIAITEERSARVDFSDPYMQDKSAIIALKVNLENAINDSKSVTMDEIARKKVGVLQGTVHDSYMVKNYPETNLFQYKSYPDLILAVKSGKVDAGFITRESFFELQKEEESIVMLVDSVFGVDIGMGFNKENDQLRELFNTFLSEIKENGINDSIIKRWYIDGSTKMPIINNKKNNGKLIVGNVSDKGLPYTIVKNNRLIGSDIELVERFGAYLGKEIVYADMDFGNLIAAVSTNKIDMITSTLMITEERKKQIDFSDPYYKLNACVFGVKKNNDDPHLSVWQNIANSFYSNIILENRYLLILDGLKITILISVFSILLGTLLGALICLMRMSKQKLTRGAAKVYIYILRGLPVLVLLMLIFYVILAKVNIDPVLVAVIAFGLNFAAYVSEIFRTTIESVDRGQWEAGIAGGFTKAQTFLYIIMPQAVRQAVPVYKGELISLVKTTSIVGYIAVQDLTKASDIIRSRTFDAFFPLIMTAILYFGICAVLLLMLNTIEQKTDPKLRRKQNSLNREQAAAKKIIIAILVLTGIGVTVAFREKPVTEDKQPITNIEQLEGKKICVITGTTGDFAVRGRFKKANILDMNYPADAALAVKTKKADAFVFDKSTMLYLVARSNNEFKIIPEKLGEADIAIPMNSDNKELHKSINSAIEKFKNDGTLDSMYKRWFLENSDRSPLLPQIILNGNKGTLRVGTCSLEEPFAFYSNGKMVGFDIELVYRIANYLDVKPDIMDMTYDAMIMGLQSKKIDIAIGNFYKMETRDNLYKYSIPYLHNDIVAIVRRD